MCPSLGSGAVEPIARSSPHIASYPSSLPLRPFSSFTPHTPPPSLPHLSHLETVTICSSKKLGTWKLPSSRKESAFDIPLVSGLEKLWCNYLREAVGRWQIRQPCVLGQQDTAKMLSVTFCSRCFQHTKPGAGNPQKKKPVECSLAWNYGHLALLLSRSAPPSLCPAPYTEIRYTMKGDIPYGEADEQTYGWDGGTAEKLVTGVLCLTLALLGHLFSSTFHLWESCKEVNAS